MIKDLFIPTQSNGYYPLLLRKGSITIFALTLFIFNITVGSLPISKAYAAIDTSEIVELHNKERAEKGLSKLVVNSKLNASALKKGEAMLAADCWSHYCPNGKSPWDFFKNEGYDYIYAGENLAEGFNDNETVMQAWMNSPTHRDNVLKPEFKEIGVAIIQGTFQGNASNVIVVVHFGTLVNSFTDLPTTNDPKEEAPPQTSVTVPLKAPIIDEPLDGASISNKIFNIKGRTNGNSRVSIIDNDKVKGNVDAEGGIFDYQPPQDKPFEEGKHVLSAFGVDSKGTMSERSNEITLTVDTVAPVVDLESLEILSTQETDTVRIRLQFQEKLSSLEVIEGTTKTIFIHIPESDYWEADIKKDSLNEAKVYKVTAIDEAGNITSSDLDVSSVLSAIDSISSDDALTSGVLMNIVNRELPSIKNVVSVVALILISALFAFDAFLLSKTNIGTGYLERGRHHLHLSNFIVLFLVVLMGGVGGTIIEGISR